MNDRRPENGESGDSIGSEKIEMAQEKVVKTKEKYEAAITELKQLMDKRDALKKEELIAAIKRSDKTYEEILEFINGDS